MIAVQVLFGVTSVLGVVLCYLEFRRARGAYAAWREGSQNGLALQVAAHQVRISVMSVVVHLVMVLAAVLVLTMMVTGWALEQVDLVMIVSLSMMSMLLMVKQLMYRYDYALIMDHAMVARAGEKA